MVVSKFNNCVVRKSLLTRVVGAFRVRPDQAIELERRAAAAGKKLTQYMHHVVQQHLEDRMQLEERNKLKEREPGYVKGHVSLLGADMHFEAIRVHLGTEAIDGEQLADVPEMQDHLDEWRDAMGVTCFDTCEIPGFPGEWVVMITPFDV